MKEKQKKAKKIDLLGLGDSKLEALIIKTVNQNRSENYVVRCYCRKCCQSWDATTRGLKKLQAENADRPINFPEDINLEDNKDLSRLILVLSCCFLCKKENDKMRAQAKVLPEVLTTNRQQ